MKKVTSQNDINYLIDVFDWNDAFIREYYAISPEYVEDSLGGRVSYGALPSMYMLICSSEVSCPSIELFLEEISELYISATSELSPEMVYKETEIELFLYGQSEQLTRAKALYFKLLGQDSWGYKLRYGYDNFYDERGLLNIKSNEF